MKLATELVKQFVDATNDRKLTENSQQTYYGTTVVNNDSIFVQLDGSDVLTPVSMATDAKNGDRVLVTVENHQASISGNITSPASGRNATDLEHRVDNIETKKMYRVETRIEGRSILRNRGESALMRCHIYSWDEDITDTLDASLFSWHRNSGDESADAEWDSYHIGMKFIYINTEDVHDNASFFCTVNLENLEEV